MGRSHADHRGIGTRSGSVREAPSDADDLDTPLILALFHGLRYKEEAIGSDSWVDGRAGPENGAFSLNLFSWLPSTYGK